MNIYKYENILLVIVYFNKNIFSVIMNWFVIIIYVCRKIFFYIYIIIGWLIFLIDFIIIVNV